MHSPGDFALGLVCVFGLQHCRVIGEIAFRHKGTGNLFAPGFVTQSTGTAFGSEKRIHLAGRKGKHSCAGFNLSHFKIHLDTVCDFRQQDNIEAFCLAVGCNKVHERKVTGDTNVDGLGIFKGEQFLCLFNKEISSYKVYNLS